MDKDTYIVCVKRIEGTWYCGEPGACPTTMSKGLTAGTAVEKYIKRIDRGGKFDNYLKRELGNV